MRYIKIKNIIPNIVFFSVVIMLLLNENLKAQCNQAVNVSDSLELVKLIGGAKQGPIRNWGYIDLIDTLGECRVVYAVSRNVDFTNSDGIFDLPFLERLHFSNSIMTNIDAIVYEYMPSLKSLSFHNFICGKEIPDLNIPSLEELELEGNCFTGSIPNFQYLPNLRILRIEDNILTGTIPNFDKLPFLEDARFGANQLTGTIPGFENCPLLSYLNVCNLPNVIGGLQEENDFIGPIPTFYNNPLLNTYNLDFTCVRPGPPVVLCEISESDSLELVNFYNLTNGENWQVNTGWLTENLTSWWGVELTDTLGKCRVKKILLRGINDEVELPALNLPFLEELYLDYNQFIGNLPNLNNLPKLKTLNLAVNNFEGDFPDISSLTNLEEINLSGNSITGNLPVFQNQPLLKKIDLSNNQFTGTLYDFSDNTDLQYLNLNSNLITGSIVDFQNIPNLNHLNLANNQLISSIPNFSNVLNLYVLDVSNNQLTGELPNFNNLLRLQSLFVQGNQLSGRIPNFNNLPILEELTVCENNFEGIPPNFSFSPLLNVEAIDFSCLQSAKVKGYVYYDTNENCLFDADDITIPNGLISINNGANYQLIDDNGYYEILLEVGSSVITFIQTSPLWQSGCEDTYTITSATINDVAEINFANQPNADCIELAVDIGTPLLRRCFKNTYTVQYCNQGTQPAIDAYIEIDFDPEIIPLSASIPYNEANNLLTFQLGEIGIGECGSFTVVDSVSCDAPLSSTGCVEAHIYPDEYCFSAATIWDGANLLVNAFCLDNDSVQFIIENIGNDMENPSPYIMYEEDFVAVQGEVLLANGATKVLNYPATGATYRVTVEQTPGHPSLDDVQAFFEFCGDGSFSTGYINSQLLPDRDSFIDIDCEEIIGSYDPNDKLVTPAGVGDRYDIYEDDELTYKIRFQNTGNDTAFTVVIVDTLDIEHLDISTIEVLNNSHPYTLAVEDAQILTFTFNDILLLDSTTNEQASHGFVTFKISQNPGNQIGDIIMNKAYIYFDYNEAIVTQRIFNTLSEPRFADDFIFIPLTVGIEFETANHLFAKVYPNPASNVFYIELPSTIINEYPNLQLKIYNIKGQSLLKHPLNKTQESVAVDDLVTGIYYYRLFTDDLVIANGKLLIE